MRPERPGKDEADHAGNSYYVGIAWRFEVVSTESIESILCVRSMRMGDLTLEGRVGTTGQKRQRQRMLL
jgi:hypothetical protein